MLLIEQPRLFNEPPTLYSLPKTQYLGSKQKLARWIFEHAPKGISNMLDGFSGTSAVGYLFKSQGIRVVANDFLKFNYHIGKAIIENEETKLTHQDIKLLLGRNQNAGSLIEDIFTGVFFERDQANFLDNFRANINLLDNSYKESLAFTIMNRALTRKVSLGHFAHLKALEYSHNPLRVKRNPSIALPLEKLFLELVDEYNNAIFNNGKDNKVYCRDAVSLVSELDDIDLAYFDPPYCGLHPDYQAFYHFLETFAEYWEDKEFINATKQYFPKKESGFTQKNNIVNSFENLCKSSQNIPYWLISYNSKSYPSKDTLEDILKSHRRVRIFEYEYANHYGGKGSRKGTKEYLFYCYV